MYTINKPVIKKGPKGISLPFSEKEQYKAYGNAKNEPKTKLTIAKRTPKTKPKKIDSLTSPPPSDSRPNHLSPANLIIYININITKPLTTEITKVLKPKKYNFKSKISKLPIINGPSKIIM